LQDVGIEFNGKTHKHNIAPYTKK